MTGHRALQLVVLGLVALGLAGGAGLSCFTQTCTLRGCEDEATVAIRRLGGQLPQFELTVEVDGRTLQCPAPPGPNAFASCDGETFVTTREVQDCRETTTGDSVVLTCTPTGRFEQVLELRGSPASVKVSARQGGVAVAEKTFMPRYQSFHPNGPECEPTCRQWSESWDVP